MFPPYIEARLIRFKKLYNTWGLSLVNKYVPTKNPDIICLLEALRFHKSLTANHLIHNNGGYMGALFYEKHLKS